MNTRPDVPRPFAQLPILRPALRLHQPPRIIRSPDGDTYEGRIVFLPDDHVPIRNTQPGNLAFGLAMFGLGMFLAIAGVGVWMLVRAI